MTRVGPRLRGALAAVALLLILVVAGLVRHVTPGGDDWQDPFEVSGPVGDPVVGRTLEVTVSQARVAERITSPRGWTGETEGVWVVVDASVTSLLDGGLFGTTDLVVGGVRFGASERPDGDSLEGISLRAGVPMRGALAFEVTEAALDSTQARLELAGGGETRLDSLLVIPLRLGDLDRVDELELPDVVEGAP